jgi:fibronectin-binding autotransporter adhesin
MKTTRIATKRSITMALAAVAACVAVSSSARAAVYWSGTNNWDEGTTLDWSPVTGGPYNAAWQDNSDAVFEGTAGTVTVAQPVAGVTSISFTTDGYSLTGAGTLTLTGAGGRITTGSGTDTIGNVLAGSAGLTKNGNGTLTLNGSAVNTLTGGVTVNGGTLALNFANLATPTDLLDPTNSLTLAGGALEVTQKSSTVTTQTFNGLTLGAGASTIHETLVGTNTNTVLNLGNITRGVGSTLSFTIAGTGSFPFTQVVTTTRTNDATGILGTAMTLNTGGSFGYAKVNASNQIVAYTYTAGQTLATANNLSDMTSGATNYTYAGGTMTAASNPTGNTLLVTGAANITLTGQTLTLNGMLGRVAATLTGGTLQIGASQELVLFNGGGAMSIGSQIVDYNDGTTSLPSALTWSVGNNTSGGNFLTLSGANTYSGGTYLNGSGNNNTTLGRGITVANASAFGTGPIYINGNLQWSCVSSGITLSTANTIYWNADISFSAAGGFGTGTGNVILGGNRTITITGGNFGIGGAISDGGNGYGVTWTGSNPLFLAGANTYSGNTNVNGTSATNAMVLSNSLAVQNSTVVLNDTAMASPLQFDHNVNPLNFTLGGLSGAGGLALKGNVGGGAVTLSVGNNNANTTYSGLLSDVGNIIKVGAGSLTLTHANTYSGGTKVTSGGLVVANSTGSATGTGTVTLNGGILSSASTGGAISNTVIAGTGPHTIAPGGVGTIGNLSVGDLSTNSDTTLVFDLASSSIGDRLIISGASASFSVGSGTTLTVNFTSTPTGTDSYHLFDFTGLGTAPSVPANLSSGLNVINGGSYSYSLVDNGEFIDLVSSVATPVPEPASLIVLALGAVGLLGRRKRVC